ncbi:hypothetical protein FA15DRAFT_672359 [Coprinopsis marcescibilis]|uniref:Uncharacterized protein n=1 Tax=Coprinopsis marcescibilis TaxID=230819 RepID=A0A5C3KN86_COPMA|nr:hypothetical protein FA15DRAFT_672359 [Coprinopsis marcescibilis]
MCAVQTSRVPAVQRLLSLPELDPNLTDNDGEDAFMNAYRFADSAMVDLFINSGKYNVNAENLQGETALMLSVLQDEKEEVTQRLLQVPDIDSTLGNRDSWTEAQKTSLRLAPEQANHPSSTLI